MDYRTNMVPGKFENEADKFAAHFLYTCPPLYHDFRLNGKEMADTLNVAEWNVDARLIELSVYF